MRSWSDRRRRPGLGAAERAAWLAGLRQLVDAAEAAFTDTLVDFDAHRDFETRHGAQSSAAWLRGALRLAPGDAATRVRLARAGRDVLAEPLGELTSGTITYEHVRAIERATHRIDDPSEATAAVELLTHLAQRVDVAGVRTAGQRIRIALDPDGTLRDAESAATVGQALAPFLVPAGPHDDRTAAQRRADGLVDLARAATAAGGVPSCRERRPTSP